jgi:peptide/nickel transport system substrate-binding protein
MEDLASAWIDAPDLDAQRRIAAEMQRLAFVEVPYLPLGQYFQPTAYRRDLEGVLRGPPVFWNVTRRA